jgi:DNA-binding transcriptional MerR regulator/quercetin dioxygenase-like cupin family protein
VPAASGDASGHARVVRVGDVAQAAGVSAQTIRLWEKQGLLRPERTAGGHRIYSEADLERAAQIVMMRRRHGWNPAAIRSTLGADRPISNADQPALGAKIRGARKRAGLTLAELAGKAGISRSFLSAIERGDDPVSPYVLAGVAEALDLPMSAFRPALEAPGRIVRRGARTESTMAEGVHWEELSTPGHAMEPAILEVPSGGSSGGAYARPGEIFVTLLSGELVFELEGKDTEVLRRGDSITLEPFTSFSWRNEGRARVRAIYVEQLSRDAWA